MQNLLLSVLVAISITLGQCGGSSCGSGSCTYTQGYWKNHKENWPVTSLSIGGTVYTQQALLEIFWTSPGGDATYILMHQLIAALLNKAFGASTTTVDSQIAAANTFLASNPLGSNPKNPARQTATDLASSLTKFNEGKNGPPHCDSDIKNTIICNDNNICTVDTCTSSKCVFTPTRSIPGCCTAAADCDDDNDCTIDSCDANYRCKNVVIQNCGTECRIDSDCDDKIACTTDTCDEGVCNHQTTNCAPPKPCTLHSECNDWNGCTDDRCHCGFCEHEVDIFCESCRSKTDCDDRNPCTIDFCRDDKVCQHERIPGCKTCTCLADCDDHDACTIDSCGFADGICYHQRNPTC